MVELRAWWIENAQVLMGLYSVLVQCCVICNCDPNMMKKRVRKHSTRCKVAVVMDDILVEASIISIRPLKQSVYCK